MSDQGDDLTTALGTVLSSATRKFAPPSQTVTKHDEQLRVALVKKFDDLDTMLGVQLRNALSSLLDLIPIIDAQNSPGTGLPATPSAIEITASTSASVDFSWSQSDTALGWYLWLREIGNDFALQPDATTTSPTASLTGLTAGQGYEIAIAAFNAVGQSLVRATYQFQTSTGTARITNTDATTKAAARPVALALPDGQRDAGYTASVLSQLTSGGVQTLAILDRSAGTPTRYAESVVCTSDANGIYVPITGTLIIALATTIATMGDSWLELQNPSDATKRIATPLNNGVLSGDMTISDDIAAATALLRSAVLSFLMPDSAFDTVNTGGGGTSGVQRLIDTMTTKNDNGWYPDQYTNADDVNHPPVGAGASTVLRPGNPLFLGYWPGVLADGIISTSQYANQSFGTQPWFWGGAAQRTENYGTGPGNTASNTRMQVADMVLYDLTMAGEWVLIASASLDGNPVNYASLYNSSRNNTIKDIGSGSALQDGRDETSNGGGGSIGALGYNTGVDSNDKYGNPVYTTDPRSLNYPNRAKDFRDWSIHGFQCNRAPFPNANRIANSQGYVVALRARKILHNGAGTDDRANAHIVLMTGCDYYFSNYAYAGEAFHSGFREVTNDFQWFGATDIPPSILQANPPPFLLT